MEITSFLSSPDKAMVFLELFAGLIAGFIDSIAGGGGLITLPALSLWVGPGAEAIGTNKIVGCLGALTAFLVYARRSSFDFKSAWLFTAAIMAGSAVGSSLTASIPIGAFSILLALTCPLILFVVWKKNFWIQREEWTTDGPAEDLRSIKIIATGLACGFYDGLWGPGGGTFMFLGLLLVVRLPLVAALGASKLANTVSAATALTNFAIQGHVHWLQGLSMASAMVAGAFAGAHLASQKAAKIVRPVLTVVVALLIARLLQIEFFP